MYCYGILSILLAGYKILRTSFIIHLKSSSSPMTNKDETRIVSYNKQSILFSIYSVNTSNMEMKTNIPQYTMNLKHFSLH